MPEGNAAGTITATLLATRRRHLQLVLNVFRMLSELTGLFRGPVFPLSEKMVYLVGPKSSAGRRNAATASVSYYWLKPALGILKTISAEESLLLSLSCRMASLAISSHTREG